MPDRLYGLSGSFMLYKNNHAAQDTEKKLLSPFLSPPLMV